LRKLEAEMQRLGGERERLEKRMAAPDLYDDARKDDLKRCLQEQARISQRLAEVEERWLALSTELEALAGG
jgi:ATP-binding cassette, subfamily F, member 3